MTEEQKMLYSILEEVISNCKSNWISLSGGLDSSIISHFIKNRNPNSLAIITKDFLGADPVSYTHLTLPTNREV